MHLCLITSSLGRHLIPVWIFNVSRLFARLWTTVIHSEEVLAIVIFETFGIGWLGFARRLASTSSTLTGCQPVFQITDLCSGSFILHSVFVNQLIKFLVSIHVHIMSLVMGIMASMLVVFLKCPARLSQWSFGLDRSASTGGWCFTATFSAIFLAWLVLELRWHHISLVNSLMSFDWRIHLISLPMGSCTQSLLEFLILTFQVIGDILSWVKFWLESFDTLWKIYGFIDQVFFLISQLIDCHHKLGFFFSSFIWSLVVHLQLLDLLL